MAQVEVQRVPGLYTLVKSEVTGWIAGVSLKCRIVHIIIIPAHWRYIATVAPASSGGAMRRGCQNYELNVFGSKNVP